MGTVICLEKQFSFYFNLSIGMKKISPPNQQQEQEQEQ